MNPSRHGDPAPDCPHCPRLAAFRAEQRAAHPDWFNAPVPPFGDAGAWLAIVGLAPGLKGANRTGRAFTGDGSGTMLFDVLARHGIARGPYAGEAADGLALDGAIIVNAVRCVPPANRPTPAEIRACRPYLQAPLDRLQHLRAVVALGRIAHDATIAALGGTARPFRFAHGAEHRLPGDITLIDSYHCSRYNQNTGRITHNMLWSAFEKALHHRPAAHEEIHEKRRFFSTKRR
jgi:uracil-DNA glycosylase family 4